MGSGGGRGGGGYDMPCISLIKGGSRILKRVVWVKAHTHTPILSYNPPILVDNQPIIVLDSTDYSTDSY